ncbi:MAG: GNAT family N-acetyltransferase [Clostridium argentinense]|uniref:GNAT family N-acetyltransferase n=1 Tax=Clostridium faecium TaxID=2762223 RepID=A0ABR8YUD3_9CLOT|nr:MULTISPECIES: GNAT family N-acetyltransferase [Clostridium]MBD8047469.1 GNAT family N-acetyltransferase [Clostridium faecium]MBS5824440.1 GNAT family N-acetyltransferase [Clostridium argentinense]MDU1350545.1 GNAT family N-acetyltransferase [Clostridium argentinense]
MKVRLKKSLIGQVENTSKFEIKKLTLEGAELEKELVYCLSKFIEGTLDPDLAGKKPDKFIANLKNGVLGDFSKRYIITAYDNDEVIGILIGFPEEGERIHIYSLHVSPEYRNRGVGSALLSRCINDMYMKNVKDIIIDVHADNKPAYHLYKKVGFVEFS